VTSADANFSGIRFIHLRLLRETPFWPLGAKRRFPLGFAPLVRFLSRSGPSTGVPL